MGCGSSKVQDDSPSANIPLDRSVKSRSGTAEPSQRGPQGAGKQTRPQSQAHTRRHSRQASKVGSKAPSRRGQTAGEAARRGRTLREASAQQSRGHQNRRISQLGVIYDNQPPEDSMIRDEINAFRFYIDQHSVNYYRTQHDDSGGLISRYIARRVISGVIDNQRSGKSPIFSLLEQVRFQN